MGKIDLLQGNLEMMILRVLGGGAQHGWGISQRIHVLSREALKIEEGSLYLSLYRMERKGWISAEWGQSENNRRAKYYSLTRAGRKRLEAERAGWRRMALAVTSVVESV